MSNYRGKIPLEAPIGALKTQLSKLLLSVDRIGWATGATSGRFDIRRTSRMLAGSERVFKSRTEAKAVTTAVTIVVDLSGSMNGSRMYYAAQTAWMLADAIDRVGCKVQVVGFTTGGGGTRYSPRYFRDMAGNAGSAGGLGQYANGRMVMMKDFHHKLADKRACFERMHVLGGGGTPDYHVVRTAVEQLSMVPAMRKIALVITDGAGDIERMREMGALSERLWNIPIVGVGIQTGAGLMQQGYRYSTVINSTADLAKGALRMVIDQLSGKVKPNFAAA